jgi:DNA-binding MarR family transcriptional regulator
MALRDLWPTALNAALALKKHFYPVLLDGAARAGVPGDSLYPMLMGLFFHPLPVSSAAFRYRDPYMAAPPLDLQLATLAEAGIFEPLGNGEYRLTEGGYTVVRGILDAAEERIATLAEPLPHDELERLADLLRRVIESCLAAPEPPEKQSLLRSRRLAPPEDAPPLLRISQYIDDLETYRDHSHLAAWQDHGVPGHAWEALSFLWRGYFKTVEELGKRLEYRGYTPQDYAGAVRELVERGWVEETDGACALTAAGRRVREEARECTETAFYAPWSCLDAGEIEETESLLARLRDSLQKEA